MLPSSQTKDINWRLFAWNAQFEILANNTCHQEAPSKSIIETNHRTGDSLQEVAMDHKLSLEGNYFAQRSFERTQPTQTQELEIVSEHQTSLDERGMRYLGVKVNLNTVRRNGSTITSKEKVLTGKPGNAKEVEVRNLRDMKRGAAPMKTFQRKRLLSKV